MDKKKKYEDFEIVTLLKKGREQEKNYILFYLMNNYRNDFFFFAYKNGLKESIIVDEIWQKIILTFYNNVGNGKYQYKECKIKTYLFEIGKNLILHSLSIQNLKYKITDETIEKLKDENINNQIIEKIASLEKKTYTTKKEITNVLEKILDEISFKKYLTVIIEALKIKPNRIDNDLPEIPDEDQQDNIELTENQRIIKAEINNLKKKCIDLLTKHHFEGINYKELADLLNTTIGTIKSEMNRCLDNLRQRVKQKYTKDDFKFS